MSWLDIYHYKKLKLNTAVTHTELKLRYHSVALRFINYGYLF